MKKKILLTASLAALFGIFIGTTPALYVQAEEAMQTETEVSKNASPYFRDVPEELLQKGEFDYGGLHYTVRSGYLTANPISNPNEVTELILNYDFGKGTVTYSEDIDWSLYTNLETVIATGTSMEYCKSILGALPSGQTLYATSCDFGSALATMPFKNIYFYFVYDPVGKNILCTDFTSNLATSGVEVIHVNSFIQDNCSSTINAFNYNNYANKNNRSLKITILDSYPYPEEVFYPISEWDTSSPTFGAIGYYRHIETSTATSMGNFSFNTKLVSEKVKDIALNSSSGSILNTTHPYRKVYMPQNTDFNFSNLHAEELIIRAPSSSAVFTFESFGNVKAIRFVRSVSNLKIASNLTKPENLVLEKIYIPNEYKQRYSAITENSLFEGMIEYYNCESYSFPTNTYLSDDGNTYGVRDGSYTIEEIETSMDTLQTLGISVKNGDVIDDIMNKYEFPIRDVSTRLPKYSLRAFDTILVPKNINATKVLEAFQFIMPLNYGQMCDGEGMTITCDTTNYKVGYNATLPITITFPDKRQISKEVTVKAMPTEADLAYILDKDDVYIITNLTNENPKSIATLMNPMMENHLMETNVEYEESPILNSFDGGYFAGNSYSATLSSGKVKLVCSDVALTETTPPDEPVTNQDGYVMKEITKIYTPESIDGSRLLSQMRDFMCLKDGEPYNDFYFGIGTNAGRTNKENYTFSAISKLSEAYTYDKKISVEIIPSNYKMGYVIFEDGDIAVLFNHSEHYTKEQIETSIKAFLTSQSLNAESLSIPTDTYASTKTYEGSYDNGKIYIVNSGVNLTFSTPTEAVDQTNLKKDYVALNKILYTKGYTTEEVLRALGKNILLKDGKPVTEKFDVEYTTKENSKTMTAIFKIENKEILKETFYLEQIEAEVSYIFARASNFDTGYLILEQQAKAPAYTLNDIMKDVISRFRTLLVPFETKTTMDFTKTGTTKLEGIYPQGNGSYYSYLYNVEVAKLKDNIQTNDVTIDGKKAPTNQLDSIFNDFKENFENNTAFKTMSILLGTILGLGLIYVIYLILHKFHKWLKK